MAGIDSSIKTETAKIETLMVDETKKWPHGKRKSFYLDLMEREPEAAMTWLRSVFHLSKEKDKPYHYRIKHIKHTYRNRFNVDVSIMKYLCNKIYGIEWIER